MIGAGVAQPGGVDGELGAHGQDAVGVLFPPLELGYGVSRRGGPACEGDGFAVNGVGLFGQYVRFTGCVSDVDVDGGVSGTSDFSFSGGLKNVGGRTYVTTIIKGRNTFQVQSGTCLNEPFISFFVPVKGG